MKNFFYALTILTSLQLKAQEKIETDRPDQTETPVLTPPKYLQGEFGFGREKTDKETTVYIHPTALIKYGLSNRVEFRLEATVLTEQHNVLTAVKQTLYGFEPIEVGTKIALVEEKGLRPKTSLIAHVGLPFAASGNFPMPHLAPSFRFTMQNSLTKNIGLGYNLGAEWDGYTSTPIWLYTFAPGFNIGERWYAYAEAFGFFRKNAKSLQNIDGGIAYYLSNNTKVDLSAGVGLTSNAFDHYVAVGFSFRLPVAKHSD